MKALTKYLAGAAAAAAMTVSAASPASAQIFGGDRYDRNRGGIGASDIITGVAVLGGIAAIASALGRDGNRYGYGNRDRYRDDYRSAVNACTNEAQRYGQGGQVNITDIERRGSDSYRVRGVIDAGYNTYGRNGRYEDRSDPRYENRYDPRYGNRNDRYDPRYGNRDDRDDRDDRYGRNDRYGRYDQRVEFACTARADGRVRDFDIDRV